MKCLASSVTFACNVESFYIIWLNIFVRSSNHGRFASQISQTDLTCGSSHLFPGAQLLAVEAVEQQGQEQVQHEEVPHDQRRQEDSKAHLRLGSQHKIRQQGTSRTGKSSQN